MAELRYNDLLSNNAEPLNSSKLSPHPNSISAQIEREIQIKKAIHLQQDKIVDSVLHVAPSDPSKLSFFELLNPSNLAASLRVPNMNSIAEAKRQQQMADAIINTTIEKTNKAWSLSLTPKNAAFTLKEVIAYKQTQLAQLKEYFTPFEAKYEKNQEEYIFFPSWRASKPEGYDQIASKIEKVTKDIHQLTTICTTIEDAYQTSVEWGTLAALLEAQSPSVTIPPPVYDSSPEAQALFHILTKSVDHP